MQDGSVRSRHGREVRTPAKFADVGGKRELCPMNDCNGKRELVTKTLRREALASRTTSTYHIQQLCPMTDCNGKRELDTRTLRKAALTCITTTTYHIQ